MLRDFLARLVIAFVLTCIVLSWVSTNSHAQVDSPPHLFGSVETSTNEPAANAKVWLAGRVDVEDYSKPTNVSKPHRVQRRRRVCF